MLFSLLVQGAPAWSGAHQKREPRLTTPLRPGGLLSGQPQVPVWALGARPRNLLCQGSASSSGKTPP